MRLSKVNKIITTVCAITLVVLFMSVIDHVKINSISAETTESTTSPIVYINEEIEKSVNQVYSEDMFSVEDIETAKDKIYQVLNDDIMEAHDQFQRDNNLLLQYGGVDNEDRIDCLEHDLMYVDIDRWYYAPIGESEVHLKGLRKKYVCRKCDVIIWGEFEYEILPHRFSTWHPTGQGEHVGDEHEFIYEDDCYDCYIH